MSLSITAKSNNNAPLRTLPRTPKSHGLPRRQLSFASTWERGLPVPLGRPALAGRAAGRRPAGLICCAASSPVEALRSLLESPGIHQGPACFDALSAKLVERAGFKFCFTSGFSISAARLGLPDVGLISYGEMIDQGRLITQAVSIPVIGDGDNGYGNCMNVKRTVKGFIKAGFSGIILEDQLAPKACGHTQGRKVVSREESIMRIKAAIDARKECGSDIVIVARTDSRQAVSLDESLWRSRAFADAGADVIFIDALASKEEMLAFSNKVPRVPKMANMLEGGGKTPILSPEELEEMGFKIVSYPLSLIGVSIRAMEDALTAIKSGRVPPPGCLPSFNEIKETLGFNLYYEEEKKYSTSDTSSSRKNYKESQPVIENEQKGVGRLSEPVVEVITPYVYDKARSDDIKGRLPGIWSRMLRIKITGRDGLEKLDIRIPRSPCQKLCLLDTYPPLKQAGFLDNIPNIIPGLKGVNIAEMLNNAGDEVGESQRGKQILDFSDTMGDRIQVSIE